MDRLAVLHLYIMSSSSPIAPVLLAGTWAASASTSTFQAHSPKTGEALPGLFPVSSWKDLDVALAAAAEAASQIRTLPDAGVRIAGFLEAYAAGIEARAEQLVQTAHAETGLPTSPRLKDVEIPRTTGQLRQAAAAARDGAWLKPVIDTKANLRSCLAPIGPVWVIGPNNFPFAFNGIAGGDFAAAIASGNPVIAKAHPLHPATSRLLAEAAVEALAAAKLPSGTVQMFYHTEPAEGLKLIADPRLRAVAFTGSRAGGLKLKAAADAAGKLFFGELSSLNPVLVLPGVLAEFSAAIVDQLVTSLLMGTGQFCTKPGLILLQAGAETEAFIQAVTAKFSAAPSGVLFSESGRQSVLSAVSTLRSAGAQVLTGGAAASAASGYCVQNTLLRVSAADYLKHPHELQTEAFGNSSLLLVADSPAQFKAVLETLEGNLTGTVYSAPSGADDVLYNELVPLLRPRVGRLINDKMPTGVAVSPAMNHGGPFPATTQPHFTAVGLPASIARFTQLECYDNVREHRLPPCLRNKNPSGRLWRTIDGTPTQADI